MSMPCAKIILRRTLMVWITIVITAIAASTVYPETMQHITSPVASVQVAIVGLFTAVLSSLSKKDSQQD